MCIKRLKKLLKNKNIDSLDEVSNKFVNNIINSAQKKCDFTNFDFEEVVK